MRTLFSNALAPNSRSSYSSGTNAFIHFCTLYHRFTPHGSILPASEETLLLFTSYLSQKVRPSTIKVYLAAVRNLHVEAGLPNPVENSTLLPRLLRGIKRIYGVEKRPRLPITPTLLSLFRQHINLAWWDHQVLWSAMLIAFFAFLRSAELLSLSHSDVRVCGYYPPSPYPVYQISIKVSKTDPFRHGCSLRLAPSGHPLLCPSKALYELLQHSSPSTSSPLFMLTGGIPLSRSTLTRAIRWLANLNGVDGSLYASHSFRSGAATTAAAVGLPESLIKSLGRWSSGAYQAYIHTPPSVLDAVPHALTSSP